jgi:hypothetical protein
VPALLHVEQFVKTEEQAGQLKELLAKKYPELHEEHLLLI